MNIEYSGATVEIPNPDDMGFDSYSELIGYTLIHSDTERALFHPHQVAAVNALAQENLGAVQILLDRPKDCGIEGFVCWKFEYAKHTCDRANENLKTWGVE